VPRLRARTQICRCSTSSRSELCTIFQADTFSGSEQLLVSSSAFNTELQSTMQQFALDHDVDAVMNMLKNRYDEL